MNVNEKLVELDARDLLSEFYKVCKRHGILPKEVFSDNSEKAVVAVRREWSIYLRNELGWGFVAIGRLLDRDHASIMHYVKGRKSKVAEA